MPSLISHWFWLLWIVSTLVLKQNMQMIGTLVVPLTVSVLKSTYWICVLLHDFWILQKLFHYWTRNIEHLCVFDTIGKLKWNALGQKRRAICCVSPLYSYFSSVKLMTVWYIYTITNTFTCLCVRDCCVLAKTRLPHRRVGDKLNEDFGGCHIGELCKIRCLVIRGMSGQGIGQVIILKPPARKR